MLQWKVWVATRIQATIFYDVYSFRLSKDNLDMGRFCHEDLTNIIVMVAPFMFPNLTRVMTAYV